MNARNLKIIFTADDFGIKESYNEAVLDDFLNGWLTSTCICANGNAFLHATDEILPKCVKNGEKIDLGVHIDLIEGKSLTNCPKLTNDMGNFKLGFVSLLLNSFDFEFLNQAECEMRAQIEVVIKKAEEKGFKVSFINSHVHTHAIPNLFKICKKLSKEYNIPFIRTQKEIPYIADKMPKIINLIKVFVLYILNLFNKADLTNDYILGVCYTNEMDREKILKGLEGVEGAILRDRKVKNSIQPRKIADSADTLVEILIHPDIDPENKSRYAQYLCAKDPILKAEIKKMNAEFVGLEKLNGD